MAETSTREHDLSKFAQGERFPVVSAVKLNANWDKIAAALWAVQSGKPSTFTAGKLLLDLADGNIYKNTGTTDVPVWTAVLDLSSVNVELALRAYQSQVDTIQTDLDTIISDFGNAILKDGSVAMEADLDLGTFKAKRMANGVASDEGVNRGQLDAVQASFIGTLGLVKGARISYHGSDVVKASATGLWGPVPMDTIDFEEPSGTIADLANDRITIDEDGYYFLRYQTGSGNIGGGQYLDAEVWVNSNYVDKAYGFYTLDNFCVARGTVGPIKLFAGDHVFVKTGPGGGGTGGMTLAGGVWEGTAYLEVWLSNSNSVGGGDFSSDGSVPMSGDLDLGGFNAVNSADATAPTSLTTLQQVEAADAALQAQIDAIDAGRLKVLETELAGGGSFAFSAVTPSWNVMTGSDLVFTLANPSDITFEAEATCGIDFLSRTNGQIGIRVSKTGGGVTDIPGTFLYSPLGNGVQGTVVCKKRVPNLDAGEYTVQILARCRVNLGASCSFSKAADAPARLGVTYSE